MIGLVASNLWGRRLNFSQTIRMMLIWTALFSGIYVLFLFRGEARAVWDRAKVDISGQQADASGRVLRIPMRSDGHFWAVGAVNGQRVDFLIDSGATTTALSASAARMAGIDATTSLQIMASPIRIGELAVGPIRQTDARATVSDASGDLNLLGMSFLSELKSWKVEGRTLILEQ
jgi:aspartyl protease family protein